MARNVCVAAALAITLSVGIPAGATAESLSVQRFAAEGAGSVNSFVLDVGGTAVIVDAQRTLGHGQALADQLAAQDMRATAILITHPHPDHVGGLASLVEATQAEVLASSDTSVEVSSDTMGLLALSHQLLPDDTVLNPPEPDRIVRDGDQLELGNTVFAVHEFGPSEALTMTVYAVPGAAMVFTGDLLSPGMTPFLLEKRTAAWLNDLDRLDEMFAPDAVAYPGHGAPGPLGPMVAEMRTYLATIRTAVGAAIKDGALTETDVAAVVKVMNDRFPDHPPVAALPDLLARNVIAVAAELMGDPGAPPVATLEEN